MGPSFAESVVQRGRFGWLLGTLCASVLAIAIARPHARAQPTHSYEQYNAYKRIGHCVDGRWVYAAPAPRQ